MALSVSKRNKCCSIQIIRAVRSPSDASGQTSYFMRRGQHKGYASVSRPPLGTRRLIPISPFSYNRTARISLIVMNRNTRCSVYQLGAKFLPINAPSIHVKSEVLMGSQQQETTHLQNLMRQQ